nr:tail fiber domain-containing protein [Brucella intermedia]
MHLRPVSFRYKASYAEGKPGMNGLKRGFIAQEAEKVLPEVARKRKKI